MGESQHVQKSRWGRLTGPCHATMVALLIAASALLRYEMLSTASDACSRKALHILENKWGKEEEEEEEEERMCSHAMQRKRRGTTWLMSKRCLSLHTQTHTHTETHTQKQTIHGCMDSHRCRLIQWRSFLCVRMYDLVHVARQHDERPGSNVSKCAALKSVLFEKTRGEGCQHLCRSDAHFKTNRRVAIL